MTGWKASSISVSGAYDAISRKADVKGLPDLKGFPAQPEVNISSSNYESQVGLSYAPVLDRPLELIGTPYAIDPKSSEMLVRFAVSRPEVLTQKTLETYLSDASLGTCYTRFKLTCAPTKGNKAPKFLFLTMGKWHDNRWDSNQIEEYDKAPAIVFMSSRNFPSGGYRSIKANVPEPLPDSIAQEHDKKDGIFRMSAKRESGDYFTLCFEVNERGRPDHLFSWPFRNEFCYELYLSPARGKIIVHDERGSRTVGTFITEFDAVQFNRIEKK